MLKYKRKSFICQISMFITVQAWVYTSALLYSAVKYMVHVSSGLFLTCVSAGGLDSFFREEFPSTPKFPLPLNDFRTSRKGDGALITNTVVLLWYSGSTNFPAVAGGKLKIFLYGSQTILSLENFGANFTFYQKLLIKLLINQLNLKQF